MLNHSITIEIVCRNDQKEILEIIPIYRSEGFAYVNMGAFEIYKDFSEYEEESIDHPGFLGELHFNGQTAYEWRYFGDGLDEPEVLQVVEQLQAHHQSLFLSGNDSDSLLSFTYNELHARRYIQLVPNEDYFLVFINGSCNTKIEPCNDGWAITTTDILNQDLEKELVRRIKAYKA